MSTETNALLTGKANLFSPFSGTLIDCLCIF